MFKKYSIINFQTIEDNDEFKLTNLICSSCLDSIDSFFDFKKQYIQNSVLLKQAQQQLDHFNAFALKENVIIWISIKSGTFC